MTKRNFTQDKEDMKVSVEHHAFSVVPGRIDRMIYSHLLREGIERQTWVVRTQFSELEEYHRFGEEYTMGCLSRLVRYGLILPVCRIKGGRLLLVPALGGYVPVPKAPVQKGKARYL